MRTAIRKSVAILALLLAVMIIQTIAQSPTPPPAGQMDGTTLSSFLQEIVTNFVAFKTTFISTVEGTLGGYFAVLAYILAWVVAVYYFIQQFIQGEWDAAQIGRFTGSLVVCLLLLVFCGDVDNDGRRGDIVRAPAYVGYYLAFGEDASEPTGSYINRMVNKERTKFNANYQKFIENKLMVKINDQDMPVRYPRMSGIQTVAAVSIGQGSPDQQKSFQSQEFWIGLLFQVMNFFRSIIEIIDFFLLVLYAFGILVCSIISPFMCCVFVNRDLRKRFTYPFFWTVLTVTIIFPAISQAFRYFAYLASNMALGTSGNPIYSFDPTTYTIVANGDPTPMILVAVLTMLISIVLLVMSLILSYSFAQGKLVESMSGLIANTFAGLSSIGVGALVSSYATKLNTEADKGNIEAAEKAAITGADHIQKGQYAMAEAVRQAGRTQTTGSYVSALTTAQGDREATGTSNIGQFLSGAINVQTQQATSKLQAQAGYIQQISSLNNDEKQELMRKSVDSYLKAEGINNEAERDKIAQQSGLLNLHGDEIDNKLKSLGIIGSIGSHFINGATVESLQGRNAGNSPLDAKDAYSAPLDVELPNGSKFSADEFLEKGILPNLPPPANMGIGNTISIPPVAPVFGGSGSKGASNMAMGGATAAVSQDGTPIFKQSDPAWGGRTLGTGSTLAEGGCAVTSMAMSASKISGKPITPGQMDAYLDKHHGYQGNAVVWDTAAHAAGLEAKKSGWNTSAVNQQLDAGRPVVAGIDYKGSPATDHWVTLTGRGTDNSGRSVYFANDPATGKEISFLQNGNQLTGMSGSRHYRSTGEVVTFSGGEANPKGFAVGFSGGSGNTVMLGAPGIPKGLPPTLLQPLDSKLSQRAASVPVTDAGAIYYNPAQEASFTSTGNKEVDSYILGAARTHQINPNLLKHQFVQESKLRDGATSSKGAEGVAQLMPGTAQRVGVTDTRNAAQSIYGGAKYMRYQADFMIAKGGAKNGEQVRSLSLAGYNAGEGAVQKNGFKIPNYTETKEYVGKISNAVNVEAQKNPVRSPAELREDLGRYNRVEAEVRGKQYATTYNQATALRRNAIDYSASQEITRQSYAQKRNIAAANAQMQYSIADTQAQGGLSSLKTTLNYNQQAAQTRYQAQEQAATINRDTGYQSSELSYQGSVAQAALQFDGTQAAAKITKDAALEALYKRNMANLVQSVGNSATHQFTQMFERASRGW